MTSSLASRVPSAGGAAHLDAFKTTGSSPGTSHTIERTLLFDHHGGRKAHFSYEVHGSPAAPPVVVLGGISASRHLAPTGLRNPSGAHEQLVPAGYDR